MPHDDDMEAPSTRWLAKSDEQRRLSVSAAFVHAAFAYHFRMHAARGGMGLPLSVAQHRDGRCRQHVFAVILFVAVWLKAPFTSDNIKSFGWSCRRRVTQSALVAAVCLCVCVPH